VVGSYRLFQSGEFLPLEREGRRDFTNMVVTISKPLITVIIYLFFASFVNIFSSPKKKLPYLPKEGKTWYIGVTRKDEMERKNT
jgi:hypothetical protein